MTKYGDGVPRWGCVLALVVFLAWAPSLMAQSASTGALTGTVMDPSGAVVPNATVTATSLGTDQARTTMTGSDGSLQNRFVAPRKLSGEI